MEPETLALLIPILAVSLGLGIPLLSILLSYRKRKTIYELHHQERMAAIEKGIEVPPLPEMFFRDDSERHRTRDPRRSLLVGLIWFFIGVGLGVWWMTEEASYLGVALIPTGIGISYLLYYLLEGRRAPVPRNDSGSANERVDHSGENSPSESR